MNWTFAPLFRPSRTKASRPPRPHRTQLRVESLEDRVTPTVLPAGFQESVFAGGLAAPTAMELTPDGRIFVAQQGGSLRVIDHGVLEPTPFLSLNVDTYSERGLEDIIFDPDFVHNGYVYVYYTTADPTNPGAPNNGSVDRLSRFRADPRQSSAGSWRTT